jgi:hypothetical protein
MTDAFVGSSLVRILLSGLISIELGIYAQFEARLGPAFFCDEEHPHTGNQKNIATTIHVVAMKENLDGRTKSNSINL